MDVKKFFSEVDSVLGESYLSVLSNSGADGNVNARWMAVTRISEDDYNFYAVTDPMSSKCISLEMNPDAHLMLQTPDLRTVISISGEVSVIDNPSLRAQIMEKMGSKLSTFWKVSGASDFVALEIRVKSGEVYTPMKGVRKHIDLQ